MKFTAEFMRETHCACCDFCKTCYVKRQVEAMPGETDCADYIGLCMYGECYERLKTMKTEDHLFFLVFATHDFARYIKALNERNAETGIRTNAIKLYTLYVNALAKHTEVDFWIELVDEAAQKQIREFAKNFEWGSRPTQENKRENL